jgi:hypothetical protein
MSYRITRGDINITKNVLNEIARRLGEQLNYELLHFEKDTDCPSYNTYQNIIDVLVHLENNQKDLTR